MDNLIKKLIWCFFKDKVIMHIAVCLFYFPKRQVKIIKEVGVLYNRFLTDSYSRILSDTYLPVTCPYTPSSIHIGDLGVLSCDSIILRLIWGIIPYSRRFLTAFVGY